MASGQVDLTAQVVEERPGDGALLGLGLLLDQGDERRAVDDHRSDPGFGVVA